MINIERSKDIPVQGILNLIHRQKFKIKSFFVSNKIWIITLRNLVGAEH